MYESLKLFLNRVKTNQQALQKLAIDSSIIDTYLDELSVSAKHIWTELSLDPNELADFRKYGTVFNKNTDGFINRPTALDMTSTGEIYVVSRDTEIAIFNSSLQPAGKFGYRSNDPNDNGGYWTAEDIAIDELGDKIYVASRYTHVVRAFQLSTGAHVWTFGVHGSPGNVSDGKLNQPTGVTIAPNGNVIVTSTYGAPDSSAAYNNYGHITELNAATGAVVSTPLASRTGTAYQKPWLMSVYVPVRATVLADGLLYIPYPNNDIVAVFDPANNYEYVKEYRKPHGFTVSNLGPNHITLDQTNNEVIITCFRANLVVGLDKDSGLYKWHTGRPGWDDRSNPEEKPGEFNGPSATLLMPNGDLLVSDYGNNRIQLLPKKPSATITCTVTIPPDYRIVKFGVPGVYDPTTSTFTMSLEDVKDTDSLPVLLEKEA